MSSVLILGNGSSRLLLEELIQSWGNEIWVCNWGFKESISLPRITKVFSVHRDAVEKAYFFRKENNLQYEIISNTKIKEKCPSKVDKIFKSDRGWATGNLAILEALITGYDEILLAGFDFGGSDIYQDHKLNGSNFDRQFNRIIDDYKLHGTDRIQFLLPDNKTGDKEKFLKIKNRILSGFNIDNLKNNIKRESNKSSGVKNIFLFGTSSFLDTIDFSKLEELRKRKDIVFAGVNRVFYKFQPDYFFFIDKDIADELVEKDIKREGNSRWITSQFLYENSTSHLEKHEHQKYFDINSIEVLGIDFVKDLKRKSSLLWLMHYLQSYEFPDSICKFFLIGVNLQYKESHYFGGMMNKNRPNSLLGNQYISQKNGIQDMIHRGVRMVSLTPDSKVNEMAPYLEVDIIKFLESMPDR